MNVAGLCAAYRTISQFHENHRLIAWLSAQPWVIWLTPERRKSVLFFGAIIAGAVGIFSRNAKWRDYRALGPWLDHGLAFLFLLGLLYALYLAAIHFKQLPANGTPTSADLFPFTVLAAPGVPVVFPGAWRIRFSRFVGDCSIVSLFDLACGLYAFVGSARQGA